ncbi:DUF6141 family protein [Aquirufa rosea]|uniref:Uncharacterized protein n=1 Tax=Aquirufa rosea TaxID=2509241 RepID=A0A4Q1BZZ2_9BACT|nr:DUF6141 family protein [Aquirufa rosea]RXK49738.1 hypothetical protein ESB04_06065 [Aquirufa rosea]
MSEEQILFTETQRFRKWWIWLILLGVFSSVALGAYRQIQMGIKMGDRPMSDEGIVSLVISIIFIIVLFYVIKLETKITSDGIYLRFFPFHWQFKYYPFENMEKVYVRKYSALLEYGGWGIRYGIFGSGKAFNVSGNQGLQMEMKQGRKVLIGTNKPEELSQILSTVWKK